MCMLACVMRTPSIKVNENMRPSQIAAGPMNGKANPLRAKKFFVLAALEVPCVSFDVFIEFDFSDRMLFLQVNELRKKLFDQPSKARTSQGAGPGGSSTSKVLEGLMQYEASTQAAIPGTDGEISFPSVVCPSG